MGFTFFPTPASKIGAEMESDKRTKPLMLKDFLREDFSSSDDFLSLPMRSDTSTTVRNLLEMDLRTFDAIQTPPKLQRSRSRAASATISTLQRASEAMIKLLPFSPMKSQPLDHPKQDLFLPRTFSRRLRRGFRSKSQKTESKLCVTVRVRDIMRWRSFGGRAEIFSGTNSSNSSWTESEFSSDFLRCSSCSSEWCGENEGVKKISSPEMKKKTKKKNGVGEDSAETATCYGKPKGKESERVVDNTYEEKEQLSPVSVLDFPDEDEESPSLSFQKSLANLERTKQQLLQKIRRFEDLTDLNPVNLEKRIVLADLDSSSCCDESSDGNQNTPLKLEEEEKEDEEAKELLELLISSSLDATNANTERLLLDFFRESLEEGNKSRQELLFTASNWISNCNSERLKWRLEDKREAHVKEMEMGGRWKIFREEKDDLTVQMESSVLGLLLDELLHDLLSFTD